ncbi:MULTISPECIES: hypothetical protein [Leptospira]|uniref:hypothetical protein n=1 Tax=Leptospira TaxID=171 RepID=UPI00099118BF|nr:MULTISPECIES: hypothetical protein [Leptospira]
MKNSKLIDSKKNVQEFLTGKNRVVHTDFPSFITERINILILSPIGAKIKIHLKSSFWGTPTQGL